MSSTHEVVDAVDELRRTVRLLDDRVAVLESRLSQLQALPSSPSWTATAAVPGEVAGATSRVDGAGLTFLVGQALLALAGAFLLRALTEQRVLPGAWGYGAGAAYGLMWLGVAYRAGTAGGTLRAFANGLVACVVVYPLLWEATVRVDLLDARAAALALAAVTSLSLGVAAGVHLQRLAWVVVTGALATAMALAPATDRMIPFTLFAIALGIATLWLGYVRDWFALRWPVALVADLMVCGVVFRVAQGHGVESPAWGVGLGLLLVIAYLGSITIRTLVRARDVVPFEMVQGAAALSVGIGAAMTLARDSGAAVGAATLTLGAVCYAVAFVWVAPQRGFRGNFLFYTTMALALVLTGVALLFASGRASLVGAGLALGVAGFAARKGPRSLILHAAVYAGAAALASNLVGAAAMRLIAPAGSAWPGLGAGTILILFATAACLGVAPSDGGTSSPSVRTARLVLLALVALGAAAWAIEIGAPLAVDRAGALDPGRLATVRTVVIALAAMALAALAHGGVPEAAWMVYPMLALGGLKLLVEDFPRSAASTLFVALASYGVALMAAPKLSRSRRSTCRDRVALKSSRL